MDQNSDFDDEKEIVSKDDTTTEQIRRYPLMKCSLKIKHLSFPALFDTGSAASLLSMDIFGRIPRNCMKLVENVKTNFVHFQTVSGEIMGSLGYYTIKFALPSNSDSTFKHNFHIVPNLRVGIILGIDFMSKHELMLYPKDRTLGYFKGDTPHKLKLLEPIPVMNIEFCKDKIQINAPEKHKNKVMKLLETNPYCYAEKVSDLCSATAAEHRIKTVGEPVSEKMRRTPHALRPHVKQKIDEMLKHQIIRKSTSPFAAPIVMVKKRGGEYRMCIDYRKLNKCTIREKYPLPNILDTLDALGGATFFSCLDLFSGYWQLALHEKDKHKTSFVCEFGQFEFNRLPFGLVNGPSTFQRTIASIFEKAHFEYLLIYLDDLIIFSKTLEEHMAHLEIVFDILHKAGLRLNLKKCNFFQKRIEYLGHVVTGKGVWPNKKNIEAIEKFPEPKNVRQVQGYLGLSTYYRRFIRNYADIAHPLYILLKKNTPWQWGEDQKNAFNSIKTSLTSFPCLRHPEFSRDFIVQTDSSGYGVGAILCQMQPRLRSKDWLKGQKIEKKDKIGMEEKNKRTEINLDELNKENKENDKTEDIIGQGKYKEEPEQEIEFVDLDDYWKPAVGRDKNIGINTRENKIEEVYGIEHANEKERNKQRRKSVDANENLETEKITNDGSKEEDLEEVVIAYSSRHLKETERKYSTTELECLAIIHAITVFRPYLYARRFVIKCDHRPLQWLMSKNEPAGRLSRWALKIQEYQFEIEYKPGKANQNADCLSRIPINHVEEITHETNTASNVWYWYPKMDDWIEEQRKDEHCKTILERISDPVPPSKEEKKRYTIMKNGIICTKDGRVVVPKGKVQEVLKLCHDHPLSGHMGIQRTLSRLQPKFTWPEMAADTIDYINRCETCLKRKLTGETIAPLRPVKPTKIIMKKMAADICGPVRESRQGNKYVLVLADYASRFVFTAAMTDQTAKTLAIHLRRIFMLFGAPKKLITDRGSNFLSETVKNLCTAFKIERRMTSAFHAQADGLVERINRTMADLLASYISDTPDLWDEYLDFVTMAYNTSKHSSTKYTPYELFMGRSPNLPIDIGPNLRYRAVENEKDLVSQQWSNALDIAKKNLIKAQGKQKAYYDKKAELKSYKENDFVLLREPPKPGKYNMKWSGPFEVTKKFNDLNYEIRAIKNNKKQVVHINRLKFFPKPVDKTEVDVLNNPKDDESKKHDNDSRNKSENKVDSKAVAKEIHSKGNVIKEGNKENIRHNTDVESKKKAIPVTKVGKENQNKSTKSKLIPEKKTATFRTSNVRKRKEFIPVRTYELRKRTRPAGV